MGYLYENSNHERFQHLCQSLLEDKFSHLQCFPVGQRDGGRDGWDPETKTVLQVKFKRVDEDDNADWMIAALIGELPKIEELAKRGATEYIMATNARGTGYLDKGKIDRVQAWLDDNVSIKAMCMWRDEIDRRFDKAPASLKLKHSELLSLEDGLEIVLNTVIGSQHERQQNAVRAFISSQFEKDADVKFKQVQLSNDLINLFVDVPVGFPQPLSSNSRPGETAPDAQLKALIGSVTGSDRPLMMRNGIGHNEIYFRTDDGLIQRFDMGAAELLLNSAAQDDLKLVVLEGAPGQGKSTLAQFVCQIHRARYLKKADVLKRAPESLRQMPFRIPFKIDLRDYAAFLEGNSPFRRDVSSQAIPNLDTFLAELVTYSTGITFDAHDLLLVLKRAPALIFLDGLDEVADVASRETLVASVGDALARWSAFDTDVQVVITSRPSIFGQAPSFEKIGFRTITLQNIDLARVHEYADKWVNARGLDEDEKRDVQKILAEKLELAHIRDLTRNPMQLTILLSLIHQVGHSLPDQRTDLYRRYVELFLTREADKSTKVREHRPVLLGFIEHLAWVLQMEAESLNGTGSISAEDLQEMARKYLRDGGHQVDLAEDLFGGGLERIFVLVERIEGLYEFEVQPLREFFCAQHLYSTAPVGTYRDTDLRGDRAQRFEALAANPLWLNVCRFYAGSCERGETGTLVLSLEEMIKTGGQAEGIHARRVALALLQDWVFSNVKYPQDNLIRAMMDDLGFEVLLASDGHSLEPLTLHVDCGRDTLRDVVFDRLQQWPSDARVSALCAILQANGGERLSDRFVELVRAQTGSDRTTQLVRMFRSGAAGAVSPEAMWELLTADAPSPVRLARRCFELVRSEPKLASKMAELSEVVVRSVLDGLIEGPGFSFSPLGIFADVLGTSTGAYMGLRRFNGLQVEGESDATAAFEVPVAISDFLAGVRGIEHDEPDETFDQRHSPRMWSQVIELARQHFGEPWAAVSLAVRCAGMRNNSDVPEGADQLFNASVPLLARTRYARLRRGGTRWWLAQLGSANTVLERRMWVALVLAWSSVDNLYALRDEVEAVVGELNEDEYYSLRITLEDCASSREIRADRKKLEIVDIRPFSSRVGLLVSTAFRASASRLQVSRSAEKQEALKDHLSHLRSQEALRDFPSWKETKEALAWSRRVAAAQSSGRGYPYRVHNHMTESRLSSQISEALLRDAGAYPRELVTKAVAHVERSYRPESLSTVASRQDWIFA